MKSTREVKIQWGYTFNPATRTFEETETAKEEIVVIRRLGFAEKRKIIEKYIETKFTKVGDDVKEEIKPKVIETQIGQMLACIVSAPFKVPGQPWNDDFLDKIDTDVLEDIWKEVDDFNDFSKKKKMTSSTDSETEPQTQNSMTSSPSSPSP